MTFASDRDQLANLSNVALFVCVWVRECPNFQNYKTLRFSRAYWVRECPRAVTLSFSISFDEQLYASRSRAFASVFFTRSAARPRRRVRPDRNLKEPGAEIALQRSGFESPARSSSALPRS